MSVDAMNRIHKHQQSTEEVLNEELEGYFSIKKINQLKQKSLNTQPAPSTKTSTSLWGKQICMSVLDTAHKKIHNTPEEKFQDQQTLIRLMQANRSIINDAKTITKTPKTNTWLIINSRNYYNFYGMKCSLFIQEQSKIMVK